MTTTYFGEITGDYLASLSEGDNSFETEDGKKYDYRLDINEDGVKITDSNGRYVPLHFHAAKDLKNLLKGYSKLIKQFIAHEEVVEFLHNGEHYALPREQD